MQLVTCAQVLYVFVSSHLPWANHPHLDLSENSFCLLDVPPSILAFPIDHRVVFFFKLTGDASIQYIRYSLNIHSISSVLYRTLRQRANWSGPSCWNPFDIFNKNNNWAFEWMFVPFHPSICLSLHQNPSWSKTQLQDVLMAAVPLQGRGPHQQEGAEASPLLPTPGEDHRHLSVLPGNTITDLPRG